ncbi:MAG: hypothetical protein WAU00_17695 [Caldilinea sp.]|uniref:hypothetical protein n=1 Tax=Caldilinea sp. TaxID=2293560 RepID=UPI002CE9A622|nr:hypothetical protein [Anaerolineales bacterium]HQY90393.1 hypothetical protein [Caldilinea sp.]
MKPPDRYSPSYRKDELTTIFQHARRGESLCYVGIAGIGKSNIVKILNREREFRRQYLGNETDTLHFPDIDATIWDRTPTGLWRLMLESLQVATTHLPATTVDTKVISLTEEETYRRRIQAQINHICQNLKHKLMFVLDDFDAAFLLGPLHMLEQFNTYRSDGNKGCLSYLIITKQLPTVLGRKFELERRSKFYDLFRTNIFALGPYVASDAVHMVRYLNREAGGPFERGELTQMQYLAGGHARLLKVIFETWLKQPPASTNVVAYFAENADVQQECERIFGGLHRPEREAALRIAHDELSSADLSAVDHLVRRGLLPGVGNPEWFSPVWGEFLRRKEQEG